MKKIVSAMGSALLLWCVLVSPITVLAAETGSTTINGELLQTISIAVPGTFSLPTLVPEQVTSDAKSVTVTSNSTGWSLSVVESGTNPDGKMARTTDSQPLNVALDVRGGDKTSATSLASAVLLEDSSTTASATISDIIFRQCVTSTDYPGTYSITVVFTATSSGG